VELQIGKNFLSGDDFLAVPQKKRQWLIEPLIPARGIVNLYGKPKTGKSFASLGMGIAISNGLEDWNGFAVKTKGNVMYLQIDTPEGEMFDRITKLKKANYDISKMYFADMDIAPYPYNVLLPQHATWLKQQVELLQPVLVFIDTLREAHELDENDSTAMKKVINQIVHICRPAAIGLISHSRKDTAYNQMGSESDIMDEGRGSSYVSGRMDTIMKFSGKRASADKPFKGHMTYKGRSKGADGKIPVTQEDETGLIILNEDHAKQEQAVIKIIQQHPEWTKHKMATQLVADGSFQSVKTATRWIEKLQATLAEDKVAA
jgi:hypothetical protein